MKPGQPHDALFRAAFGVPRHAVSWFAASLPAEIVRHLDLSVAERCEDHFVDETLRAVETDLLYRVLLSGREAFLYVLLEHQSRVEPLMPFRVLRYVVRFWEGWLRRHEGATSLPPVIPLVLYHGRGRWTAATELTELIDAPPGLLDALRPHLPAFSFRLEDLGEQDDETLRALETTAFVRLVLLLLKHAREADASRLVRTLVGLFSAASKGPLGFQDVLAALHYLAGVNEGVCEDDIRWLAGELQDDQEEVIVTLADKWREEGRAKGREEGLEEGLEEGRVVGRRLVLVKQLRLRFRELSDEVLARVEGAGEDELDAWAERLLTAPSAEEAIGLTR